MIFADTYIQNSKVNSININRLSLNVLYFFSFVNVLQPRQLHLPRVVQTAKALSKYDPDFTFDNFLNYTNLIIRNNISVFIKSLRKVYYTTLLTTLRDFNYQALHLSTNSQFGFQWEKEIFWKRELVDESKFGGRNNQNKNWWTK